MSRSSVHHTCSLTKTDGQSLNSECLSTCTLNTQHVTQRPSEGLGVDSSAGLACRDLGTTIITHTVAGALGHTCNPLHSAFRRRQPEVQSSRLPSATGHIQGRSGLWETISAAAAVKTETKTQKHQATLAWLYVQLNLGGAGDLECWISSVTPRVQKLKLCGPAHALYETALLSRRPQAPSASTIPTLPQCMDDESQGQNTLREPCCCPGRRSQQIPNLKQLRSCVYPEEPNPNASPSKAKGWKSGKNVEFRPPVPNHNSALFAKGTAGANEGTRFLNLHILPHWGHKHTGKNSK